MIHNRKVIEMQQISQNKDSKTMFSFPNQATLQNYTHQPQYKTHPPHTHNIKKSQTRRNFTNPRAAHRKFFQTTRVHHMQKYSYRRGSNNNERINVSDDTANRGLPGGMCTPPPLIGFAPPHAHADKAEIKAAAARAPSPACRRYKRSTPRPRLPMFTVRRLSAISEQCATESRDERCTGGGRV